uniref:(northern house mosquito) hypothetical protein n=1 Tax=Culex pipiens TaxID=7175 RepID=A0A8D8BQC6_CULPI
MAVVPVAAAAAVVAAVPSPLQVASRRTAKGTARGSTTRTNTAESSRRMESATARGHSAVSRTRCRRGEPSPAGARRSTSFCRTIKRERLEQQHPRKKTTSRWNRRAIRRLDLMLPIGDATRPQLLPESIPDYRKVPHICRLRRKSLVLAPRVRRRRRAV